MKYRNKGMNENRNEQNEALLCSRNEGKYIFALPKLLGLPFFNFKYFLVEINCDWKKCGFVVSDLPLPLPKIQ